MSDAFWLGVFGVMTICLKEYFDARRATLAAAKVEQVKQAAAAAATKVEQVKADLKTATDKHKAHDQITEGSAKKLDALAGKVDELYDATNGVVEKLVAEAEERGRQKGLKEKGQS